MSKENSRLKVLQTYEILDTPPEKEFDDIAQLAAQVCGVSFVLINFLGEECCFIKSQFGIALSEYPYKDSFCAHTLKNSNRVFEVEDTRKEERFKSNPLVTGEYKVKFYAGAPLVSPEGHTLGTLCVMDQKPGKLTKAQTDAMKVLANQVVQLLELRKTRNESETSKLSFKNEAQRLNNIIEASQVGTWEWNVQTGELRINDRWAEIIGYTKEELAPTNIEMWYKVVHPYDRDRTDKELQACFKKEVEFYDTQCRVLHKEGHEVWINDRGRVVSWTEDGKPLWMMGTHTDITEVKNTEQQFLAISDNIPGAVFRYRLSPDGKDSLEMVSKGALELWGVSAEEAMRDNASVWKNFDKNDLELVRESIRTSARKLSFWQFEWRYHHPSGKTCWHRGSGNPWRSEDGSTVWDAMILDISEQKSTEIQRDAYMNALEERIKERTVLYDIAQLSHEAIPFHELLQKVAKVIPSGLQYTKVASASIAFANKTFNSEGFKKTKWSQSVHRYADSGEKLEVTVAYSKKMPEADRGPFFEEEWYLLNNIADNLIITLNHRAAVEHNELILQTTSEGIYGIDEKGECTFINNAAAKMLGFSMEECLGQNMHQLIHHHTESGDLYPEKDCPVFKSRNDKDGCRINNETFWTKENKAIPVRYSSTPILVDGKFKGAVVVFNDISETKKAERELQIRERRFRALVENGADAVAILNEEGKTIYASPSTVNILGYTDEEAMRLNLFDIIHPEDQKEVAATMQESFNNPGVPITSAPSRVKHKNGSLRWVEATITNLLHDPAVKGMVDNFRDVTERVQFENHLKASEEKYRSLFDTSPLPMWIYDLETGGFLDVNQTTSQKYGYSREEFLNLHITDLRPESELPVLVQVVNSAKTLKGTKRFGVFTHLKKNGESMRVDISGHRLQFDNKDSLLVVANDVTESEAAFEALQVSEARYRGFYESQTNFIIRTDMDGNYTYVNKKFEDDFGWIYTDGELIGKNCLSSIMAYDHPKVFEIVEKCVQSPNKVQQAEIDKPAKNGGTITTLWEFVCLVNERGEPHEIQCVGMDVTDRINTERALKKSHERYELVSRATNDAIYDWDVKNDHFVWGDGFYRLFNYAPDEFETFSIEDWTRLTHPVDSAAHQQAWDAFMSDNNQHKWVNSFRFKRADGTYAYVEEIGYMLRDEDGQPERMIGVLRDQTRFKLAEIQEGFVRELTQQFKISSSSLSQTLQRVVRHLSRAVKSKTSEIWLTSSDNKHLNLVASYAMNKSSKIFFDESWEVTRMKKGKGLPGVVWKKNQLTKWSDIRTNPSFVRQSATVKSGLKSMIGIPLTYNEVVIGVLMMGYGELRESVENNVELLNSVGPVLGAEIKRKQQEEQLQLFFEYAPEILAVADPNGYFSKVNPAFSKTLGFSAKELTSKPIFDFIHPDDIESTIEEYQKNKSGSQQAKSHVNRYLTKDGGYKWMSWNSSEPYSDEGHFFAYGRDITAQKIAEENLSQRTMQLNTIARINSRLINYDNWFTVIDESFAQIADVVNVDRVYYFKNGTDKTTGMEVTSQVLEWSRENVESHIDNPELQGLPVEMIAEFFEPMLKNEPYQGLTKKIKNPTLHQILVDQDIKSILCIPIIVGNSFWGFIGFDDCTREREWTTDEIVFLRTIASNLATAIESHESDLKLKEAHDERSNILESIGDAFFAVDKNWVVTYWNKEAERVLGKSKDEMLGKALWEKYEDAKSLKFYSEYHHAMKTGKVVNFEEYYPATDHWYEVSAYPSIKGLSVYFKDVTLRKKVHEQIRLTKERFEKVTQATNDAIWDFDVTKNELFWGQGFDTLFGYNPQKIAPTFDLLISKIHPDDRGRVVEKVENFMKVDSATNWHEEYRFLKADGAYAYVIDRAVFIRNHQGEVTRVVGAMTDISYRKEHEESLQELNDRLEKHARDLERSNAELEQFAYIASHDLQEPLRMVTSFLDQLERKYSDNLDDKAQQYIYYAVDGARRMRQIILDLLEFSRVGRTKEDATTVDLNELIDGYRALRKTGIEERSATIHSQELPAINGYKTPVTQIFHNLIDNAIKYSRVGVAPEVRITAKDKGDFWEFCVSDNGIGIEEEYFKKIFVIFQRLHDKSEYSGTGMGLAIVRKIIENLGGKIWLTSKMEEGSNFFFTLPKHP